MTVEEIKIRQLTNQYLITPSDKLTVVRDLCGLQSQFFVNAMHALKIRCSNFDAATFKNGLVKNWTIRGTVHVFAEEDLPLFMHCNNGTTYRKNEWSERSFWNQRDGWALTPDRQAYLSGVILDALAQHPLTREELKSACREKGMTAAEESSMFDPWGGGIRELCERGFLNYVVQEEKAFCLSPGFTPLPQEEAELEIARRYFTNIAPATIHDAMYYFHVSAAQIRKWLSQLPVTSVECNGKVFYYIENEKSVDQNIPECIFLAGFDQLMLGYEKKESLYLKPEYLRRIFNLAGIVMPSILLNGEVIGKWKKKNRKLTIELFQTCDQKSISLIKETAASLWTDLSAIEVL